MIKGGINRDEKLPKSRLISFPGGMQELPILPMEHSARKLGAQLLDHNRSKRKQW